MAYPPVVVVDRGDCVVGSAPLPEAWAKGLIHRIVYVIVEDDRGRLLIHQRAPGMRLYPGCWDVACGHVDVTPDYLESARIELHEEAGIKDASLTEIAYFYSELPYQGGTAPKRFIKIFHVTHTGPTDKPHEDEVAASRWCTRRELRRLQADHPEQLAFGLELCLPYILGEYANHGHQTTSQAQRPLLGIR